MERFTRPMGQETGLGSAFAQIVTPGALERLAGFVADLWRASRRSEWQDWDDEDEDEDGPQADIDPVEEMDQTEIVQIVRRDDLPGVGIDHRGLEVDTAISLLVQGLVQLVLDNLIDFEDEDEDGA